MFAHSDRRITVYSRSQRLFFALNAKSSRQEKLRISVSPLLSLNWLFAALTFGLIVYGGALTATITSGAWFGRERTIVARG